MGVVEAGRCYCRDMEALRRALADDPRIAYALLFGSGARGCSHEGSDVDVAVAFRAGGSVDTRALGELVATLEGAAGGRRVDLLLMLPAACCPRPHMVDKAPRRQDRRYP